MIVLSGAELVLPDRILSPGTMVIDAGRIAEIRGGASLAGSSAAFAFHNHYIVPGFIDVHVHGVEGYDSLDEGEPVAAIAARLPRYGVTAFCPTTVACTPDALRSVLEQVARGRAAPAPASARILPAHLESNFINPEFRGAQPQRCVRSPRGALVPNSTPRVAAGDGSFDSADVLRQIELAAADVAIVTLAPELDGALELVEWLVARGVKPSLGHSAANYEEARAAIGAGARRATHLFNRMLPIEHRRPGLAGAALESDEIAVELICDGVHVHPAVLRMAVAAKRPSRVMAITDGTAAAALNPGRRAMLGGQPIATNGSAAVLPDGVMAGSIATMDMVFRTLVRDVGLSPVDATALCATTPARELGLVGHGVLAEGAVADIVVLDSKFEIVQTYVGGQLVYSRA